MAARGRAPRAARRRGRPRPASTRAATSSDVEAEAWERVVAVNLLGHRRGRARRAARRSSARGGRVVTVASTLGCRALPDATAYCASKFGVVGFTRALAAETGRPRRRHAARARRHADARSSTAAPSSTGPAPTRSSTGPRTSPPPCCSRCRSRPACEVRELSSSRRALLAVAGRADAAAASLRALGLGDLLTAVPALARARATPSRATGACSPRRRPLAPLARHAGAVDEVVPRRPARAAAGQRSPAPTSPSTCTAAAPRATACSLAARPRRG